VLPLGDRALGILIYLAERPGKVIAKQELLDHIWSDVTVEEGASGPRGRDPQSA
jgi:DNA-binding winged helix-turn-helix (wHTH) protein